MLESPFFFFFNFQLFQVPLEEEGQRGGPILAPEEIKTIFGSIPDIFDVHTKIKVNFICQVGRNSFWIVFI